MSDEPDNRLEAGAAGALAPGYTLAEYRIERILAVSPRDVVYLAADTAQGGAAVVKEYLPDLAARAEADPPAGGRDDNFERGLERFLVTARKLLRINHPSVVRARRIIEANNTAYLVMDHEEGETLETLFAPPERPSEARLRALALALLDGLDAMHAASLYHGAIKPGAILMRPNGSAVLLDYDASPRAAERAGQVLSNGALPGYAPIELYTRMEQRGPWSDLYSLAAVLYRAVTGRRPLDATDRLLDDRMMPAEKAAEGRYSADFLRAIDAALSVRAEERPQNLAKWREMIDPPERDLQPRVRPARTFAVRPEPRVAPSLRPTPVQALRGKLQQTSRKWQLAAASVAAIAVVATAVAVGVNAERTAPRGQPVATQIVPPDAAAPEALSKEEQEAQVQRQLAELEQERQEMAAAREREVAAAQSAADAKSQADAKTQAEARAQADAKARADEEARQRAVAEAAQAKTKVEEDSRQRAVAEVAEAKAKADAEARQVAEAAAKAKADDEARQRATAEAAQAKAKAEEDARQRTVAEAQRIEQENRARAEARAQAAEKAKAEEETRQRAVAEAAQAKAKADEAARQRAELQARADAEETARVRAEAQREQARLEQERVVREEARARLEAQSKALTEARVRDEAARADAQAQAAAKAKADEEARQRAVAQTQADERARAAQQASAAPAPSLASRVLGVIMPDRAAAPVETSAPAASSTANSAVIESAPVPALEAAPAPSSDPVLRLAPPPAQVASAARTPAPARSAAPAPSPISAAGAEIGRIGGLNSEWGYVIVNMNQPGSMRVGDRVYAQQGADRLWLTVQRVDGYRVSAAPQSDPRRYTSNLRVFKE